MGKAAAAGSESRVGTKAGAVIYRREPKHRMIMGQIEQDEFYAFGPALSWPGVVRFRSDQVRTIHLCPGQRHLLTAPAPSQAIRGVLAAVEHERQLWQRKLEKTRARFRQMAAATSSAEQSLQKLKFWFMKPKATRRPLRRRS